MYAYRLAYDGRPYYGFQRQPDVPTVEGALLDALGALGVREGAGTPPGYAAAGRTDAGVSAAAQTVAFDAPDWCTPAALNGELPATVRAWARAPAPAAFHATHDATRRTYRYHLHAPRAAVDDAAVRAAADRLAGAHDFHNLTPDDAGTERDLSLAVERDGAFLVVRASAGGFARQLVRRLVGLLDEVGRGTGREAALARVDRVLGAAPLDGPAGVSPAPPEPLVLVGVRYPDLAFEADPDAVASARDVLDGRRVAALGAARALGSVLDGVAGGVE
ncbi:MAG: tRNA pseudouridine(38-40) synthase TruA [Haloferacaceae archaeon]